MTTNLAKPHSNLILVAMFALAAVAGFVVLRSARSATSKTATFDSQIIAEPASLLRAEAENRNLSPIDVSRLLIADMPRMSREELHRLHRRLQLEGDPGYAVAQAVAAKELRRVTINRAWQWNDNALAYSDPDKAWALAWNAEPDYRRSEWLNMVLKAINKAHGAETALKYLKKIDDDDLRYSLAVEIVMAAVEENPELAVRLSDEYPQWRDSIMVQALRDMVKSDPRRALESVKQLPLSGRPHGTDTILEEWLKSDADAALAWIEEQSEPPFHPDGHALEALAVTDPLTALGFAQRTGTRTKRLRPLSRILSKAMNANGGDHGENGEAVAAWMRENLNATELAKVVSKGAQFDWNDPPMWQRELAASALEHMEDVSGDDRISHMVREWDDFEAKRAWVEELPDIPRRRMSCVLLPEWSARNSQQAADLLRAIPTTEGRALVLQTGIKAAADRKAFIGWAAGATSDDAGTRALVPELAALDGEGDR